MNRNLYSYKETDLLSKLVKDYIFGQLPSECALPYPDNKILDERIQQRISFTNRKLLCDTLTKQYKNIPLHAKARENLSKLANDNTFTVCTGHQLCLFLGPLYVVYKILHTIKLAQEYNEKCPSYHIVPVFWLASEDHDTEEINHVFIHRKKIHWPAEENIPAGEIAIQHIREVITEWKEMLGTTKEVEKLEQIFLHAYKEGVSLADATKMLINELFGKYGLLMIDGNDAALKRTFLPVVEKELQWQTTQECILSVNKMLEKQGYKPQVNPREINLFYLKDRKRLRILKTDDGFAIDGTNQSYTFEALMQDINQAPQHISPNVLLRPLYQETVLPNLAYIGGPGEVAYWLQLPLLFKAFDIPMPLLYLRTSVVLPNAQTQGVLNNYQLSPHELFAKQFDAGSTLLNHSGKTYQVGEEWINKLTQKLAEDAEAIDPSLMSAAEASVQKIKSELAHFEKKVNKVQKQQESVSVARLEKACLQVFPQQKLHERVDNFSMFYKMYGEDFFSRILEAIETDGKKLVWLNLDN